MLSNLKNFAESYSLKTRNGKTDTRENCGEIRTQNIKSGRISQSGRSSPDAEF
jgi:hypothetical protein